MSNVAELQRIEQEAGAEEAQANQQQQQQQAGPEVIGASVEEEFADFLDVLAKVGGKVLPTVPQRFTHDANADIAAAAVKLCEKYGYDARAILIGGDSKLGVWVGLVVAVGLPGYMCWGDYKAMTAAKAAAEAANDGNGQQQQQG